MNTALAHSGIPQASIRVLLVEDEPGDAQLVRIALRATPDARFEVEWVDTLGEALKRLARQVFDALLLDLSLPDSEGIATLRTAGLEAGNRPIIVLTGRSDTEFALAALEAGAADYLVKGDFGHEGLSRAIRYALYRTETDAELAANEARFRHFFESALLGMAIAGPDQSWRIYNRCLGEMLGYDAAEMAGLTWEDLIHPNDQADHAARLSQVVAGTRDGYAVEKRLLRKDGQTLNTRLSVGCHRRKDGQVEQYFLIIEDITQRKRVEAQLRLSAQVVESAAEAILVTSPEGIIESVNPAFTAITGYAPEEALGKTPKLLQSGHQDAAFYQSFWQSLVMTGAWQGEIINRRKNGETYPQWLTVRAVRDEAGITRHYVAVASDLSAIRQAEHKVERLTHFDPLTGLPNRERLQAELGSALDAARREAWHGAVAVLNLKRFRELNQARGMAAGDQLLRGLAERLKSSLGGAGRAARLGSDQFALLLTHLGPQRAEAAQGALVQLERLSDRLEQPLCVDGADYQAETYCGVALFPGTEDAAPFDLLREAETALSRIKQGLGERIAFFEAGMGETARARFALEQELRLGLASGELQLHLQPQMDAAGRITGFEALARWPRPGRAPSPPGQFIPLAEASGLIIALDGWVFGEACRLAATMAQQGHAVPVAVNLSPRSFARADFVSDIRQRLAEAQADPSLLVLEVTERLFLHDCEQAAAKMRELAALGLRFSIDDFGTGYSALAYLKRLPIHELKIDQSFIRDLPDDPDNIALVEAILAVARHLKLRVVAEGVETAAQAEFLRQRGPVIQQGYFHGRPAPARDWLLRLPLHQ
jgi:PAS domain S-box-containing protein/diguanylate cyclase (GGDEF)-like protein